MRIYKHILPCAAILLLLVWAGGANYLWLSLNNQPPVDDEAIHLISALKYWHILQAPSVDMVPRLLHVDVLYPPLFPFVGAIFALLVGKASTLVFCMTNVLFLLITFGSLYLIGLKVGNRWSGVLAAYLLMLYPMYFHLSRMFMIETALVAMVTLCLALLMYSGNFKKRKVCVWAGIVFGLGLLTKQTFPFFILGPAIFLMLRGWKSGFKKERLINAGLFLIIGAILALPWYLTNIHIKYAGGIKAVSAESLVPYQHLVFSFKSAAYYLSVLTSVQLMGLFSYILLVALALILVFKKSGRIRIFGIWIVIPYLILWLFPNKFYYYTVPYLPAIAFLMAWGVLVFRMMLLRLSAAALVLLLGVRQFIDLSFFAPLMMCAVLQGALYTPRVYDSQAVNMVERIAQTYREKSITVGVWHVDGNEASQKNIPTGSSGILLNKHMLQYSFDLKGILTEIIDLKSQVRRADGRLAEFLVASCPLEEMAATGLSKEAYVLTDVFELADRGKVYLYQTRQDPFVPANVKIHHSIYEAGVPPHEFYRYVLKRLRQVMGASQVAE